MLLENRTNWLLPKSVCGEFHVNQIVPHTLNASPNPPVASQCFLPCPSKNQGVYVLFKPSSPYLPFLSYPGAPPAGSSDFHSFSCLESSFPIPLKASSIFPHGAASPGDTACSQHRLKRRKSHETLQRVFRLFPSQQLMILRDFPSHTLALSQLLSFSHQYVFSSHWGEGGLLRLGDHKDMSCWWRWRKSGEEPPPWG